MIVFGSRRFMGCSRGATASVVGRFAGVRVGGEWSSFVFGDFNIVLRGEEKRGGACVTPYEICDFQECATVLGLQDVPSIGMDFTWTNKTVWSKLDRAMFNESRVEDGPILQANFLPPGTLSDHSPCLITWSTTPLRKVKPFKFFDFWATHPDFSGLVARLWEGDVVGSKQFELVTKLKGMKRGLKELNLLHFGHISRRVEEGKKLLEGLQVWLHDHPEEANLSEDTGEVRRRVAYLEKCQRSYLVQKAKAHHSANADKGTSYFHSIVKRNAKRNCIVSVVKDNGVSSTSIEEVEHEFTTFFMGLMGSSLDVVDICEEAIRLGASCDREMGGVLVEPIVDEEIKMAMFSIDDSKAPGPNGFSAGFFKKSWATTGSLVSDAVHEFFRAGKILKQWNHSFIALIPKCENANRVNDFRPISLQKKSFCQHLFINTS